MNKLAFQTLQTFVAGFIFLGLLTFLPAWSFDYWQGWVFIGVFLISVNGIGLYLALKDPALLERRKKFGPASEQRVSQKIIITLALISTLGLIVFSAIDHRLRWSAVPAAISIVGDALIVLGLGIDLLVFRVNSYGASNVRIEAGQKTITTGPYALVRHPMYLGILIMVLGMPLALGSWWGLAVMAITLPLLALRILDEEKALHQELAGYADYEHRVKFRLIPGVW